MVMMMEAHRTVAAQQKEKKRGDENRILSLER